MTDTFLNLTDSAKFLGISRRKFRRIAPPPDRVEDDIYPFWSTRVLAILPTDDDFDYAVVFGRGKACGFYLLGPMDAAAVQLRRTIMEAKRGRPRRHTCGFIEATSGMDVLQSAKWFMEHCKCPPISLREGLAEALAGYDVAISFRTDAEAKVFQEGILAAINKWGAQL